MATLLGPSAAGLDLNQLAREYYQMRIETGWGRIRELRKAGWNPEIQVEGLEHLNRGLSAGRGAILWGMRFCGGTVSKRGLRRAGVRIAHLGRADHLAPSLSWLGLRIVAPLEWRAETKYLERRVVIPLDESLQYMRELLDLLRGNGCVSITGELQGRQNVTARFFGGLEEFATGAPALAWKTGCALLTYHVVREGPLRYRVIVGPPISADRVDRQRFVERAVAEFAARVQQEVIRNPASWDRWDEAGHEERIRVLRQELTALLPAGTHFILADADQFGSRFAADLRSIPFVERDKQYWGHPPDDQTAIAELERLRSRGITFLVLAWPTFWWLDHYTGFRDYLSAHFRRVASNERLIVFDLR